MENNQNINNIQIKELLKQISVAAHDLNNALSVVRGYPDILMTGIVDQQRADFFLEQIKFAAAKAADSTGLLLALGRCANPEQKKVDLVRLIRSAIDNYELNRIPPAGRICFNPPADLLKINVMTSEVLFLQLFSLITDKVMLINGQQSLEVTVSILKNAGDYLVISWNLQDPQLFSQTNERTEFADFVSGMVLASLNCRVVINQENSSVDLFLPA